MVYSRNLILRLSQKCQIVLYKQILYNRIIFYEHKLIFAVYGCKERTLIFPVSVLSPGKAHFLFLNNSYFIKETLCHNILKYSIFLISLWSNKIKLYCFCFERWFYFQGNYSEKSYVHWGKKKPMLHFIIARSLLYGSFN